jgi:hypothetical protein
LVTINQEWSLKIQGDNILIFHWGVHKSTVNNPLLLAIYKRMLEMTTACETLRKSVRPNGDPKNPQIVVTPESFRVFLEAIDI